MSLNRTRACFCASPMLLRLIDIVRSQLNLRSHKKGHRDCSSGFVAIVALWDEKKICRPRQTGISAS